MKSRFTSFIMNLVLLLIIFILSIFGILLYQEVKENKKISNVEEFVSKKQENEGNENIEEKSNTTQVSNNTLEKIAKQDEGKSNLVETEKTKSYRYFYNQLNTYAKVIYDALDENKEKMKSGTYKIEFGSRFSALLNEENGTELLEKYYQSAIETFLADNPDVFYIKPSKLFLTKETITRRNKVTYNVYIDNGKNSNYLVDEFNSEVLVKNAIEKIEEMKKNILSKSMGNSYYDIKMIHNYLIDNVEYESSISKGNIYNIYGALINKEAVCEGYAKAFKYLLDGLNIPCVIINGKATNSQGKTENHAWNGVQIDGKWYGVDVTWDDPIIIGNGKITSDLKYKYFLKGEELFKQDHIPERRFTEGGEKYTYPVINNTDYR